MPNYEHMIRVYAQINNITIDEAETKLVALGMGITEDEAKELIKNLQKGVFLEDD